MFLKIDEPLQEAEELPEDTHFFLFRYLFIYLII